MQKIKTKIYRINDAYFEQDTPKYFINQLIKKHNEREGSQYQNVDCQQSTTRFNTLLFVHKPPRPKAPPWQKVLLEISSNNALVKSLKSENPAFVMFFYDNEEKEAFIISGGSAHHVILDIVDTQFGFSIIEKLIDTSNSGMRRLSERVFLGPELASDRFFRPDHAFDDEDAFGKYFRALDVFIDKKTLKEIGVQTPKSELLVKGDSGFTINTAISIDELISRIEKLSKLLKRENPPGHVELNPFKKLTRSELKRMHTKNSSLEDCLNQELERRFHENFKAGNEIDEIYHPKLIAYLNCTKILLQYDKKKKEVDTSQRFSARTIIGHILNRIDQIELPEFRKIVDQIKIKIYDDNIDQFVAESKLKEWFFGEVTLPKSGKKYIKFENEWFNYTQQFSDNLNARLKSISDRISTFKMNIWDDIIGNNEGAYNDSCALNKNTIVGDRRFHNNIEFADQIAWIDDQLYIIHVKNGLDGKLRILQSQIINSAKVFSELTSDLNSDEFRSYYIKLLAQPANENDHFPSFDQFKEMFKKPRNQIKFVFAFATKSENISKEEIFNEITESKSVIAKISILHSFYTIRKLNFEFYLAKIIQK